MRYVFKGYITFIGKNGLGHLERLWRFFAPVICFERLWRLLAPVVCPFRTVLAFVSRLRVVLHVSKGYNSCQCERS